MILAVKKVNLSGTTNILRNLLICITLTLLISFETVADDNSPPTKPRNLNASPTSQVRIDLSWDAANDDVGVVEYKVFRDEIEVATVKSGVSFADRNLLAGTLYSYFVTAIDAAGNESTASSTVSALTLDTSNPTVPQNLSATPFSEKRIDLLWDASTDNVAVSKYIILKDDIEIATTTTPRYTARNLLPNVEYRFKVSAEDTAGNTSSFSKIATATTLDLSAPTIPQNLSAISETQSRVNLTWDPSTDNDSVTGYNIYRDDVFLANVKSRENYENRNVDAGTLYNYHVTAVDSVGNESGASASITVLTLDTTSPSAPQNLTASVLSQAEISLIWDPSSDNVAVTKYTITMDDVEIASTETTGYIVEDLQPGVKYHFKVIAHDAVNNSSNPSGSAIVTTLNLIPANFKGIATSSSTVELSWDHSPDNSDNVTYQIYRNSFLVDQVSDNLFVDSKLNPHRVYTYQAIAIDDNNNGSEPTDQIEITTLLARVPPKIPNGIFTLIGDSTSNISQELIDNPNTVGFTIIGKWQNIETSEGVYDWTAIDKKINSITSRGKLVRLALTHGGLNTPQWVFDLGIETFSFIDKGSRVTIPLYWDALFLEKKINFINEIGKHFAHNTNVFAVSSPCVNARSGDWFFPAANQREIQQWLDKGYSTELVENTCQAIIDAVATSSPDKFFATAVGPIPRDLEEDAFLVAQSTIDYANINYPGRLIPMSGSLGSQTPTPAEFERVNSWQLIYENAPNAAGQLVWFVTNDKECTVNGEIKPCDPETVLLQTFDIAFELELAFLEVYMEDVGNDDLADVINYGANLLGRLNAQQTFSSNETISPARNETQ